jgi:hypothetical protein
VKTISIKKSQDLIKDPNLKANLIYIKSNFERIQSTIKILESKDYLLSEAMIKIKNVKLLYIYNTFHIIVHHFKQHFKWIFKYIFKNKNIFYSILQHF